MEMVYCRGCGKQIHVSAETCPSCGAVQKEKPQSTGSKNRIAAALIAFFLGGIGIHKFYLGRVGQGILYLLFFWTLIPAILAFIEFIVYLCMSDESFDAKYNQAGGSSGGAAVAAVVAVVVFIPVVGILAAIAIPAYQDYIQRALVSTALNEASTMKISVSEYIYSYDSFPSSYGDIGENGAYALNEPRAEIGLLTDGRVYVEFADQPLEGQVLFEPYMDGGALQWRCTNHSMEAKYLPADCR